MKTITPYEIIKLRDQMSTEELREITNRTKEKFGYVGFREIFQTMGYTHAFNNQWYKENIKK